ncbi:MAG: C39 family peptidase [Nocardioidaceae bacterium]
MNRPRTARPRSVLAAGVALAVSAPVALTALTATGAPAAQAAPPAPRHIAYHQWDGAAALRTGSFAGTSARGGRLRIVRPTAKARIGGKPYAVASWTSRGVRPGFGFTEAVPSWEATTPRGTFVQVQIRGVDVLGRLSSWDTTGRWASDDRTFHRTTLGLQKDDLARVETDTWVANQRRFRAWQVRVSLFRRSGSRATPTVDTVGAMVSSLPSVRNVATSRPGVARGRELTVPHYSQMPHRGQYPQFGGGGEAWCSPTATTMVLAYYRALPPQSAYRWVDRRYRQRVVDYSARMVYDVGYRGTGNWPFNTAYAARRTGHAFVTRFASLRGVEHFIRAGIPVVTSITFGAGQLAGSPIRSTNGHVVVVVGFTKKGNVVVNDPAAKSSSSVRRVYARGQFEDAWLQRYRSRGSMRGSGGLGYVIYDGRHHLPARHGATNW